MLNIDAGVVVAPLLLWNNQFYLLFLCDLLRKQALCTLLTIVQYSTENTGS